jgi:hypothetical protein
MKTPRIIQRMVKIGRLTCRHFKQALRIDKYHSLEKRQEEELIWIVARPIIRKVAKEVIKSIIKAIVNTEV